MNRFVPLFDGQAPQRWLVTGAAGFIGSNLVEALLSSGQQVVGLDNFATGHQRNLDDVRRTVGESAWKRFVFIEGELQDPEICALAVANADVVLHQAALGSVPRSIAAPMKSFSSNVIGFATLITAAKDAGLQRFVYASSSSVYGDHPGLPKVEHVTGNPLSPYAATKSIDEQWADAYARTYGLSCVGLRYFNVFGRGRTPMAPMRRSSRAGSVRCCVVNRSGSMATVRPAGIFVSSTTRSRRIFAQVWQPACRPSMKYSTLPQAGAPRC